MWFEVSEQIQSVIQLFGPKSMQHSADSYKTVSRKHVEDWRLTWASQGKQSTFISSDAVAQLFHARTKENYAGLEIFVFLRAKWAK